MITHLGAQPACATCVQLDRDNPSAGFQQRQGECSCAGSEVDNQLARPDGCTGNDLLSPMRVQSVPAPRPSPGHDAP
jgi:hypothetical protein